MNVPPLQRVIGTVQSAVRGGLMCSRSALKFASDRGLIHVQPDNIYLDEVIGWGLAALGAYTQVSIVIVSEYSLKPTNTEHVPCSHR